MANRITPWSALAVVGIFLLFIIQALHFWSFTIDDVFISMRYAENLVAGNGLVFNPGERVEGYSNLSFTLLLALGHAIGVPTLLWAKLLGFLSGIATLVLIIQWPVGSLRVRLLAAALLSFNSGFSLWSTNGMETVFFAFLLTLGTFLLLRDLARERSLWAAGLVFGLMAVTRPEGGMYLAPALFAVGYATGSVRRVAPLLIGFAIPVGCQMTFRILYYGALLPLTFHAKVGPSIEGVFAAIRYYVLPFLYYMATPIGLIFLLPWKGDERNRERVACYRMLAGSVVLDFLFCIYVHGDWTPAFRFLIPVLPGLMWLVAEGFERFLSFAEKRSPIVFSKSLVGIGMALLGVSILTHSWAKTMDRVGIYEFESWWSDPTLRWEDWIEPSRVEVARWITENSDPDDLLSTGEAGIVPYLTGLRLLDTGGLNTPEISEIVANPRENRVQFKPTGNDHPIALYVEKKAPDILYTDTMEVVPPDSPTLFDGRYELAFKTGDLWLVYLKAED
jgi:hypothetical protein